MLLLTTAGIVNAGLATAREWEDLTIKELLLAPISRTSLIIAKMLSGWFTTLIVAATVIGLGSVTGYLEPDWSIVLDDYDCNSSLNCFSQVLVWV